MIISPKTSWHFTFSGLSMHASTHLRMMKWISPCSARQSLLPRKDAHVRRRRDEIDRSRVRLIIPGRVPSSIQSNQLVTRERITGLITKELFRDEDYERLAYTNSACRLGLDRHIVFSLASVGPRLVRQRSPKAIAEGPKDRRRSIASGIGSHAARISRARRARERPKAGKPADGRHDRRQQRPP